MWQRRLSQESNTKSLMLALWGDCRRSSPCLFRYKSTGGAGLFCSGEFLLIPCILPCEVSASPGNSEQGWSLLFLFLSFPFHSIPFLSFLSFLSPFLPPSFPFCLLQNMFKDLLWARHHGKQRRLSWRKLRENNLQVKHHIPRWWIVPPKWDNPNATWVPARRVSEKLHGGGATDI